MADPDLHALVRFLPELERPDFSPGYWSPLQKGEDGVLTMPYAVLSSTAEHFIRAAYESGWVLTKDTDFIWTDWIHTAEAEALFADPDMLAQATPHQLAQLLTVSCRRDRFCEGWLLDEFESGWILAIVRRAARILQASDTAPGT